MKDKSYTVKKILKHRMRNSVLEYLIQWANYDDPTWEPLSNLNKCDKLLDEYNKVSSNI